MNGKTEQKKTAMDVRYVIAHMEVEDQSKKQRQEQKVKFLVQDFI